MWTKQSENVWTCNIESELPSKVDGEFILVVYCPESEDGLSSWSIQENMKESTSNIVVDFGIIEMSNCYRAKTEAMRQAKARMYRGVRYG